MFGKLNIKNDYILIAAGILLLLAAWQFAFKKTIEAWKQHRSLAQQVLQAGDLSYQPGYLERKNHNLDKILNLYKADTLDFRSNELSKISLLAEQYNVKLSEVPSEDPVYHTAQSTIQKLAFEGDYFALVKTLNALEVKNDLGAMRTVGIAKPGNHLPTAQVKTRMIIYLEIAK
jgi:hypothetical protein